MILLQRWIIKFAAAWLVMAGVLSSPSVSRAQAPASFDIVKIDPNPNVVNESFLVVVVVTNQTADTLRVAFVCKTQTAGASTTYELAPNSSRVIELSGRFSQAGRRQATVTASWQTSRTRLVAVGPGKLERRPVFESLGSKSAFVTVLASPPARPQFVDLGPNELVGTNRGNVRSGVIEAIVGTDDALFAVPKTGGVWRSVNGGPWQHLPTSPPRAFSIAIDPVNTSHLIVGERDDDTSDPRLGRSGLWESFDFGNSWQYVYDPAAATGSQALPAVMFSPTTSATLFATSIGVGRMDRRTGAAIPDVTFGRRDPNDPQCGGAGGPVALGRVTALAVGETRVWARTASELFFSDDDGRTWHCRMLPPLVDVPGFTNVRPDYNTASAGANDNASLAAFDDMAFVIFQADALGNRSPILMFDVASATTPWVAAVTGDNDGRGLNGRRFVKTGVINALSCSRFANRAIGTGRQVIYGSGQGLQQATALGVDRRIVWGPVVISQGGDEGATKAPIHSDLWDFLLPRNYCPPQNASVFVATDGGVFRGKPAPSGDARLSSLEWETRSDGLHVHTAQDVIIVDATTAPPPVLGQPIIPVSHIVYPTQDNGGWWRMADGRWRSTDLGILGDSNFVIGDQALAAAAIWRELLPGRAILTKLGDDETPITLNRDQQAFDRPKTIQAVQSLAAETPSASSLDVVMLVQLPLKNSSGDAFDGALGTGAARNALIRNSNFNANPDGPAALFKDWSIVSDALPAGAQRVWVSGGHAVPEYFLYTDGTNPTCANGLWRFQWTGTNPVTATRAWRCVVQGLVEVAGGPVDVGQHGPAFVNPYDADIAIVAAGTPNLLRLTTDGGAHFCDLPVLSALVTDSGRYPIAGVFSPRPRFDDLGSRFHGYPFSVPSQIAFNRFKPQELLVASPYTGLYVGELSTTVRGPSRRTNCGDPNWREPAWKDASSALPSSRAYISGAVFAGDNAVLSTAGRGVYAVSNLRSAPLGSYFAPSSVATVSSPMAALHRSDGSVLGWGRVSITITDAATGQRVAAGGGVRADAAGRVITPILQSGAYIVDLRFLGDGTAAPSAVKFRLQVR